jgi:hypothetical protein
VGAWPTKTRPKAIDVAAASAATAMTPTSR